MKKAFKIIFILLVTVAAICGTILFVYREFEIKEVTVTGSERYTSDEIRSYLIKDWSDKTVFLIYLKDRFSDEEEYIPFIESYEITVTGKNSINVKLYEKIVIGCAEVMGRYMYFDREGIVVESSKEWDGKVPVITGLMYDEIVLYQPLNIQKKELFEKILEISRLIDKYGLEVGVIDFNSLYEITLTISGNEFMLGKRENYDVQVSNIGNILSSIGDEKLRVDMTDFDENNRKLIAQPIE